MANIVKGGLIGPTALQARNQAREGFRNSMTQVSALGNEIQRRREVKFTNWAKDVYEPALAAAGGNPVELARRNPNIVTQYNSFLGPNRRAADTTAALAAGESGTEGMKAGAEIDYMTGRLRDDIPTEYHSAMDDAMRTGDTSALSIMLQGADPALVARMNEFFTASIRSGNDAGVNFRNGSATNAAKLSPIQVQPISTDPLGADPTYTAYQPPPPPASAFNPAVSAPAYTPVTPAPTQPFNPGLMAPAYTPVTPVTPQAPARPLTAAEQYAEFLAMQRREVGLQVKAGGGVVPGNPQASLAIYDQATGEQHSPAMVSDAEFIMNPQAVKQFGPILKMMNDAAPNPAAALAPTSIPGAPVFAEGGLTNLPPGMAGGSVGVGGTPPGAVGFQTAGQNQPVTDPPVSIEQMTVSMLFDYKKELENTVANVPDPALRTKAAEGLIHINEAIEAFRNTNLDGVEAPTSGTPTNLPPVSEADLLALRQADAASNLQKGQALVPNMLPGAGQAGKNIPRVAPTAPQAPAGIPPIIPQIDPNAIAFHPERTVSQDPNSRMPFFPQGSLDGSGVGTETDGTLTNFGSGVAFTKGGSAPTPTPTPPTPTNPIVEKIINDEPISKKEEGKIVQDTKKARRWLAGHIGNASSMATAAQSQRIMELFYPDGLDKLDLFQSARDREDLNIRGRDATTREGSLAVAEGNLTARGEDRKLNKEELTLKQNIQTQAIENFDREMTLAERKQDFTEEQLILKETMDANALAWVDQSPMNKNLWDSYETTMGSEYKILASIAKELSSEGNSLALDNPDVVELYESRLGADKNRVDALNGAFKTYYLGTGLVEPDYVVTTTSPTGWFKRWRDDKVRASQPQPQPQTPATSTTVPAQASTFDYDAQSDALVNDLLNE